MTGTPPPDDPSLVPFPASLFGYFFHPRTAQPIRTFTEWIEVAGADPHVAASTIRWKTKRSVWVSTVLLVQGFGPEPLWETLVLAGCGHPEAMRFDGQGGRYDDALKAVLGHAVILTAITRALVREGHTVVRHDDATPDRALTDRATEGARRVEERGA